MGDKEQTKQTVDLEGLPKEQAQRIAAAMRDQDFSKLQPTDFIALEKLVSKGKEKILAAENEKREKVTGSVKEAVKKVAELVRSHFIGITDVRFGVTYGDKEHPDGEVFVAAKRDRELVLSIGQKAKAGANGVIKKGRYAGMTRAERRAARKAEKEAGKSAEA